MKKICVITGTRAEYGLLYWLIKAIQEDKELTLQLLVTGAHLSDEYGSTYKEIEKDFKIDRKIDIQLNSDTPLGISKSMAIAQVSFTEAFLELKPDAILILGDRYEIFNVASAALISRIPIIHLHGGETTQGAIDEAIRHSLTKMSHIHFTSTQKYKDRVIQLGENPNKVFNVGAMGIENIRRLKLLSKEKFEESIDYKLNKKNIIVTFHPVTLENNSTQEQFQELLDALDELEETNIIFTKANADADGKTINHMIENYVAKNTNKSIAFASLGQLRYLSALKYVNAVVGNSSSGLLEVPSFKIGTINIGDRQKGRIQAKSVINCNPKKFSVLEAFQKLYSKEFQKSLKDVKNPYEKENTCHNIIKEIKVINFTNIIKKEFYDLKY